MNNVISLEKESRKRGQIYPSEFYIELEHMQRHLENLEATYGTAALTEIIDIMGLSKHSPVKRKNPVKKVG